MRWIGGVAVIAGSLMLVAQPARAHNDWGLPLLGGAVGGYALSSIMHSSSTKSKPASQPAHAAAPPPAPATAPTSVEQRLHELDQLAEGGYITKQEYDQRRKAIIDTL